MGVPANATQGGRLAHPRRGLGLALILTGLVLAASGLAFELFLPQPYAVVAGFFAGAGITLMIMGPALVFSRWQFARNLGFCPSCGANITREAKLCTSCGSRIW
jgi:MFS superfamily sulfate permease-like transporter